MANDEARTMLRSLNSDTPTYVSFVNNSRQTATAWWLDFSGHPASYGDIGPGESLQIHTHLTHPWVFRTSDSCAKLLANGQEVYFPTLTEFEHGFPAFIKVMITTPVYTLQEMCCMLIQKKVKREDFYNLDIPGCLKQDLTKTQEILEELHNVEKALRFQESRQNLGLHYPHFLL